jgi:hypothetical protein
LAEKGPGTNVDKKKARDRVGLLQESRISP